MQGRAKVKEGAMSSEAIYVGIDVSKARLDIAVRPSGECFSVPNTDDGIDVLLGHMIALSPDSAFA
jgi:transposase